MYCSKYKDSPPAECLIEDMLIPDNKEVNNSLYTGSVTRIKRPSNVTIFNEHKQSTSILHALGMSYGCDWPIMV